MPIPGRSSNVVWKNGSKVVSKLASPVTVGEVIFMVSDSGELSCWEIASGREVWKQQIGGHFAASPIFADGRI